MPKHSHEKQSPRQKSAATADKAGGLCILCALFATVVFSAAATPHNRAKPPAHYFSASEITRQIADDGEIILMDFSRPFSLDNLPEKWEHRTFWFRRAAKMSFVEKDKVHALRVATDNSASMLFRRGLAVALADYPHLAWQWFVEKPITSDTNEREVDGDDHPARLFLTFITDNGNGEERQMEIIWGNRLLAGDYKFTHGFPHYVARGGDENIGRWYDEEINLAAIYQKIWNESPANARLTEIAIFSDSDETDSSSIAYFSTVRMTTNNPDQQN